MALDVSNLRCGCPNSSPTGCPDKFCDCEICIDQHELAIIKQIGREI